MAKYLNDDGLLYLWQKLKTTFIMSHQSIKTLKTNNTTSQTASASETIAGSGTINLHKVSKTGSYNDLLDKPTIGTGSVTNVATGVGLTGGPITTTGTIKANLNSESSIGTIGTGKVYAVGIDSSGKLATNVPWIDSDATTSAHGLMSTTDKTKLNGIAEGAQVNQNAFSNVAVSGQTTVAADTATDTVTLAGAGGITITTNANTDTVTFTGTTYSAMDQNEAITGTSTVAKLISAAVLHGAITDAIGDITGVEFRVVQTLPSVGEPGVIYLVPHSHGTSDVYDEYIWVSTGGTESIGYSTAVNMAWSSVTGTDFWPNGVEENLFTITNGQITETAEAESSATTKPSSVAANGKGYYTDGTYYYYYEYASAGYINRQKLFVATAGSFEKIGSTDIDLSHYWQNNDSTSSNYLTYITNSDIDTILAS